MGAEQLVTPSIPIAPAPQQTLVDGSTDASGAAGGKQTKEVRQPFPWKVYEMLEDAEAQGFDDIVSWNAEGNGFVVHNKERFTKEIISKYFKQSRYKSFQRQLSLYGFDRAQSKGMRSHPKLLRGQKNLCRQMKPVGYKPRGRESKKSHFPSSVSVVSNKDEALTGYTSSGSQGDTTFVKQRLPSVVSSDSIYRTHPISPCPDRSEEYDHQFVSSSTIRPRSSITERLVTTDSKVVFEGMPFYLMVSLPPEPQQNMGVHNAPVPPLPPAPVEQDGTNNSQLMKKAWDIGFAAAETSDTSTEIVPVDSLDVQLNSFA
mmetsp:Transcript_23537/g.67419  ORF Transcript_23537/g.67419 Transcript_23537/m.67419 type:complete len:316 (-) Transcript_23537:159-1106(-)